MYFENLFYITFYILNYMMSACGKTVLQICCWLGVSVYIYSVGVYIYYTFVFTNLLFAQVIDTRTVHISGEWDLGGRDNDGSLKGYINIQRYVKQPDGKWLLELDDWTVEPTEFLY